MNQKSKSIDINCDMGEGFGPWVMGRDLELLDHITSANIACGFHAGDFMTMHQVVGAALQKGVRVGAHPGLPDLQGFGRRAMKVSAAEVQAMVIYQVGALAAFAKAAGGGLSHVKPHGALYNMAAKERDLADAIAAAVRAVDARLVMFGSGEILRAAQAAGLHTAAEVFADRSYQNDGSLTPRSHAGAMIEDESQAAAQVLQMVQQGTVTSVSGQVVSIAAQTLCIHGDQPGALDFARHLRAVLQSNGIRVAAPASV
ncbi:MAG: LamB/YcsF family protein [Proteobacteria bacterium]|nr:LamB/YcsF family protein [Pseudomonadota bacterium]MBS0494876.1 LamB/YcsF family protein [Pseudomonadota bacterium]